MDGKRHTAVSEPTLLPRWKFKQCGRELTMTDKHICAVKMYVLFEHYVHIRMACNRQNM